MEPSPESTNWNLPQPAGVEQRPNAGLANSPLEQGTAEVRNNPSIERGPMPTAPQFSIPQPLVTQQQAPQNTGLATTSVSSAVADDGLVAADNDRMEREWVEKAKKIVEQTRQDPYLRTQGFTELKADYLQKRYGKVLEVSE